jgi:hypothetical protein
VHDEARSGRPSVVNDDLVRGRFKSPWGQTVHNFVAFLAFPTDFKDYSLWNCVRSFELSEVVLTLGAEDALWGAQNQVSWQCFDLSHAVQ